MIMKAIPDIGLELQFEGFLPTMVVNVLSYPGSDDDDSFVSRSV